MTSRCRECGHIYDVAGGHACPTTEYEAGRDALAADGDPGEARFVAVGSAVGWSMISGMDTHGRAVRNEPAWGTVIGREGGLLLVRRAMRGGGTCLLAPDDVEWIN